MNTSMNEAKVDELIKFSEENPWKPHYPSSLVRRFLTELTSSQNLIFELHDQKSRISTAVLLDKVSNPANDACLEILGMRSDVDPIFCLAKFFTLARENMPLIRSGFQVGLPDKFPLPDELQSQHGLRHYYDTFEMVRLDLDDVINDHREEIIHATTGDRDQVYEVLCESFSQSPDTSIPDAEIWKNGFLKSPKSHFYLWIEKKQILGFAALIVGEDNQKTEIRNIGVLSNARGKGIGQHLLNYCLKKSSELGCKSCHLTVAVTNQKALGLYLRAGFKVTEKFQCYRVILRDNLKVSDS
jgi:ribosomal protein S18 acetylase RimI-like enzyme